VGRRIGQQKRLLNTFLVPRHVAIHLISFSKSFSSKSSSMMGVVKSAQLAHGELNKSPLNYWRKLNQKKDFYVRGSQVENCRTKEIFGCNYRSTLVMTSLCMLFPLSTPSFHLIWFIFALGSSGKGKSFLTRPSEFPNQASA
jgi:hypothetical protein